MSKSFSDKAKIAFNKSIDRETVIETSSELVRLFFDRRRDLFQDEKEIDEIARAVTKQMDFHLKSILQNLETLRAAEGHRAENRERLDALMEREAQIMTRFGNALVYIQSDPDLSQRYFEVVDEKSLKEGFRVVDRERQLEIHRWLKSIIEGD